MSISLSPLPALDRDALYYPYIHIRDINWLKATLLCFPQVRRIMPAGFLVTDTSEIRDFARVRNAKGEPLLTNEFTDTTSTESPVSEAQQRLLRVLREHEELIVQLYRPPSGDFRIHTGKVMTELADYLVQKGLAKPTARPSQYLEESGQWISLDPRLGEAIMSIVAIALARYKGLDIVTSSGTIHQALLTLDEDSVVGRLVGAARPNIEVPPAQQVDEIAMIVMRSYFDVDKLTAEQIGDLIRDGKDLRKFKNALMPIAQSLPSIIDQQERKRRLQEKALEVIEEWKKYKKSLPRFALDAIVDATDVKFPDLAAGILLGGTGFALASGAGLAIGVLAWKGVQMFRNFREQSSNPYNYLSKIQATGAALVLPPVVEAPDVPRR